MIITIDGISGQGKSTVGETLAERLGYDFLSTGKMVRYVAYKLMNDKSDALSPEMIVADMTMDYVFTVSENALKDIRVVPFLKIVTDSAYCIKHLYEILEEYCENKNIVLDGRDTFRYFPNALLKYYFQSNIEDRVAIRMKALGESKSQCYEYFKKRDAVERNISLDCEDLIIINPLKYTLDELVERMYKDACNKNYR